MRLTKTVPDNDLLKRGIEILFRELGKVDAIWFLTIGRLVRQKRQLEHA